MTANKIKKIKRFQPVPHHLSELAVDKILTVKIRWKLAVPNNFLSVKAAVSDLCVIALKQHERENAGLQFCLVSLTLGLILKMVGEHQINIKIC